SDWNESAIKPYSEKFAAALAAYCQQWREVLAKKGHHDQRRALLMNFLRIGFGIETEEVELEHKIKANEIHAAGRIDAFWRHLITEVKTDLDKEREDARSELKKYFEAQRH